MTAPRPISALLCFALLCDRSSGALTNRHRLRMLARAAVRCCCRAVTVSKIRTKYAAKNWKYKIWNPNKNSACADNGAAKIPQLKIGNAKSRHPKTRYLCTARICTGRCSRLYSALPSRLWRSFPLWRPASATTRRRAPTGEPLYLRAAVFSGRPSPTRRTACPPGRHTGWLHPRCRTLLNRTVRCYPSPA